VHSIYSSTAFPEPKGTAKKSDAKKASKSEGSKSDGPTIDSLLQQQGKRDDKEARIADRAADDAGSSPAVGVEVDARDTTDLAPDATAAFGGKQTFAETVARAAASNTTTTKPSPQGDFPAGHTHMFRVKLTVARQLPLPENLQGKDLSIPFIRPSKDFSLSAGAVYAVRLRSAFTSMSAAYFSERGYVRSYMSLAGNLAFIPQYGAFPVLLLWNFQESPIGADPGQRHVDAIMERCSTIVPTSNRLFNITPAGETPSPTTASDSDDEASATSTTRSLYAIFGAQAAVIAARDFAYSIVAPEAANAQAQPTAANQPDSRSLMSRAGGALLNVVTLGRHRPETSDSARTADPSEERPAAGNTTSPDFVIFRSKRTYLDGLEYATAFLTRAEARDLAKQIDVTVMPMSAIDEYDDSVAKRMCSIRWKGKVDVKERSTMTQKMAEMLVNAQRSIRAHAWPSAYGNARILLPRAFSHKSFGALRRVLGDDAIIIPDVPLQARTSPTNVPTPKRTIFKPAPKVDKSERFDGTIHLGCTLSVAEMLAVAEQLKCKIVDYRDEFTNSPMWLKAFWDKDQAEWFEGLQEGPLLFQIGTRRVHLEVNAAGRV
jgi:hypothetical protein